MDFLTFLKTEAHELFHRQGAICFRGQGQGYPLLFFSTLFNHAGGARFEHANTADDTCADLFARLSTSFLGQTSFYWLKNLSGLKGKKGKQILEFLKTYQGPNGVAFFVDATSGVVPKEYGDCVDVPEKIDQRIFLQLAVFLGVSLPVSKVSVVSRAFKVCGAMSLDAACQLMQYLALSGRSADQFVRDWFSKIVTPEHSLLELGKQFFARDGKKFFTLWSEMDGDYPAQFWISFWSDQLWRTYNFVEQSRNRQFSEAKRISYRLPYNVTQRLWRDINLSELRAAHDFLYSVDCSLKNGGAPFSLELFYTNFFTGQFV